MSASDSLPSVHQAGAVALEPAEAFAAIAYITVRADGNAAEAEVRAIVNSLPRMRLFQGYSDAQITGIFDRLESLVASQGIDSLLQAAIASLPQDLRETAFAVSADIVFADGKISEEEVGLLNWLYPALEISDEIAEKILDVMAIKNRG
jgi:uncharacterized tellurite resistance protein B-like protein